MAKVICSVYDAKAEVYGQPMFLRTNGEAIRSFVQEVNREESMLHAHPEDYTLFLIGHYDEETGELVQENNHVPLARAIEHVNEGEVENG